MQLDKFTQKSREAIQASISLAAERKHAQVQPIHLLAALLRAQDSLAQRIIDRIGVIVDVDTPLNALPTLGTVAEPATDPDVLAVLRAAEHEARRAGRQLHHRRAPAARRSPGTTRPRARRCATPAPPRRRSREAAQAIRGSHSATTENAEEQYESLAQVRQRPHPGRARTASSTR